MKKIMKKKGGAGLLFILIFLLLNQCDSPARWGIYNIIDFGAKPDGTVQTAAIQEAIDECHEKGGGTVLIPPGEFISGSIQLRSNITLKLENGSVLKGSLDTADYRIQGIRHGLIYARNVENVSIIGEGTLDGMGTEFMLPDKMHVSADFQRKYTRQDENFMPEDTFFEDGPLAYDYRPGMMVVILSSENIKIRDVTFKDSPEWTIRFGECDGVYVDGISIYNNLMIPNSDGIHCTASRNVRISNCDIRAGDDAIIVTGFPNAIGVHGDAEI
jgi:polygalacturonase